MVAAAWTVKILYWSQQESVWQQWGESVRNAEVTQVRITGGLWYDYQQTVKKDTVPYQWAVLNDEAEGVQKSGAIRNFRLAAGLCKGTYYGTCFQDSDVGKWLEGVAYLLAWAPDAALEARADGVIALLAKAQQPDGYLNTYFTVAEPEGRLRNLRECDELYCFGHLAEAAAAYAQTTGKRDLLTVACRYADWICRRFGPEEGQIAACDGHPEAELAFVRLYEATGEERYLRQAGFQLSVRGREPYYYDLEWERNGRKAFHPHLQGEKPSDDKAYDIAECPPAELDRPMGHAVKLCYLLSGMAAYGLYAGDGAMLAACRRVLGVIIGRQQYVTGAVGTTRHKEAFTRDYHLPNDRAYAETCASVALATTLRWMLRNGPDAAYADNMERVLYNACAAGISADGRRFFYANPMEVYPPDIRADPDYAAVTPVRQPWFWCACCPPNLTRLLTGLGSYLYVYDDDTVYVNLYVESEAEIELSPGCRVSIRQTTRYPWEGTVRIDVSCDAAFHAALRLPGWCGRQAEIRVNGALARPPVQNGYAVVACGPGACAIELTFPMTPYAVEANPAVRADAGKIAVMRGPVLYCAEECDNGPLLHRLAVDPAAGFTLTGERLRGAPVLRAVRAVREAAHPFDGLYRPYRPAAAPAEVRLVPYAFWGNRRRTEEPEEMLLWLRRL